MSFKINNVEPTDIIANGVILTKFQVVKNGVTTVVWEKGIEPKSWHTLWTGTAGTILPDDGEYNERSFRIDNVFPQSRMFEAIRVTGQMAVWDSDRQEILVSTDFETQLTPGGDWETLATLQDRAELSGELIGMKSARNLDCVLRGTASAGHFYGAQVSKIEAYY